MGATRATKTTTSGPELTLPDSAAYTATTYQAGGFHWTHYRAKEPGVGARTLVLVHGVGHNESLWTLLPDNWVTFFTSQGHHVIALSLPGHRPSQGSVRFRSIQSYLRAMRGPMEALGLADEQTIYIGHSLGGLLVQLLLARHPTLAGGIVVDCSAPHHLLAHYLVFYRRFFRKHPLVALAASVNPGALFCSSLLVRELLVGQDADEALVAALQKHLGRETSRAMIELLLFYRKRLPLPGHKLLYLAADDSAFFSTSDIEASAQEYDAAFLRVPGAHSIMLTSGAAPAAQAIVRFINARQRSAV